MLDIGGMLTKNASETLGPRSARSLTLVLSKEGKAPQWLMLLPAGPIDSNGGSRWLNYCPHVVVAHFKAGGLQLPFDSEHGSEKFARCGEFVPAARWIVDVINREGEIWGSIEPSAVVRPSRPLKSGISVLRFTMTIQIGVLNR
jgi:hypothetical protein